MEQSTFKLAVYVIVALVLAYLFFFQFAPLYLWKEAPQEVVKKNLDKAETQLGVFASQEGTFTAGYTVKAEGFESPDRAVVFNCNKDLFCCEKGEDCEKAVQWDNTGIKRYFSFSQEKIVPISTRCRYEKIYICKVYLGEEPAQAKIDKLELDTQELDLAESNTLKAAFEVENTGKQDMIALEVKARVFKKLESSDGAVEKIFKKEFSKEFPLESGAKQEGELEIEITENGDYEVEITAVEKTDETNYETKTLEAKAFGEVTIEECVEQEMPAQEKQKCDYLLPCKCKTQIECEAYWREKLDIPIGENLGVQSQDEKTQEIVLEYLTGAIPAWCDEKTMDCTGECIAPATCTALACSEDKQNCVIWLPCDCGGETDISQCMALWSPKIGANALKQDPTSGKLYVEGQKQTVLLDEFCYVCNRLVQKTATKCILPTIGSCGSQPATPPEIPQPQQPEPEKPAECVDGQPQTAGCVILTKNKECVAVLPCVCMSLGDCTQAWTKKIIAEWSLSKAPTISSYTYNGKEQPAIIGKYEGECPNCLTYVGGCSFSEAGIIGTTLAQHCQ
ncbi:MAG: hypothetical protein NT067_04630 [Candidatus Diapherotrites archaeon]|nr:hypothetical protein [Candidatus Diapherotrites archaeon]